MPRTARNGAKDQPAGFVVEQWPLDRLVGYARNPRRVPEAAIDKLAAGIREFGWRVPVIVDDSGTIIAGHTRVAAARRLGLTEVPVHIARDLTPQQAKAFRLFDNRVAQDTEWDLELAALEVEELTSLGVDLSLTGFEVVELERFMPGASGSEPDLDELEREHGEHDEEAFWPRVVLRLPPEVKERYDSLMASAPGGYDWQRFEAILTAVDLTAVRHE